MEYKDAGVDREQGYEIVDRIREASRSTHDDRVLNEVGSFGALYRLGNYRDPVLVSGTDGVGTKLHLAAAHDALEGVGIDCVAMCVNDILCHGAEPLFFLDYLAYADLSAAQAARVVYGVAEGCRLAGCALVGGESAQMPGTYRSGDFDIAGFAVGVVEREAMITGRAIREGDSLIGLASSGIHSNGFSLVRALLEASSVDLFRDFEAEPGAPALPLWKSLLEPTRIYVRAVGPLLRAGLVHGMAHITGGGLYENVPRMFDPGQAEGRELGARIFKSRLRVPSVFDFLQSLGVGEEEMFHTFNMGTGMVLAVDPLRAEETVHALEEAGVPAVPIGEVISHREGLCLE